MSLNIVRVTQDFKDAEAFETPSQEAFPPEEYMPLAEQRELQRKKELDILALYEGANFVGFMSLRLYKQIAYLFFLAISPKYRSGGYGSQALGKLKELYSDKQLVVDFELTDAKASNNEQRIRRRNFYLKNGFAETKCAASYFGVSYEIFSMNQKFDFKMFQEMLSNLKIADFSPSYFEL